MHPHDESNLAILFPNRTAKDLFQSLSTLGFQGRWIDRIPSFAHDGQSYSMVKHLFSFEIYLVLADMGVPVDPLAPFKQLHIVVYPHLASRGFSAAVHCEADELLDPGRHIFMGITKTMADYALGAALFQRLARGRISFEWTPRGRALLQASNAVRGAAPAQ
jgi:hypothetical protein